MAERDLLGLIERCYACVAGPDDWGQFLAECSTAFSAPAVSLAVMPVRYGPIGWSRIHGLTTEQIEELLRWAPQDPRAHAYWTLAPGEAFNCDASWDVEAFKRSPYYAEYQHKLDLL